MEIEKSKLRFRIVFILDVFFLLIIQVLQGAALNYYFIKRFEEYFTTYFLFILDFFCLCLFTLTFVVSYNYFAHTQRNQTEGRRKFTRSMEKRFPKSNFGVLPLSYMSWIFYALILIGKLCVIFGTDIVLTIQDIHKSSSHIFQIAVAVSSIVFTLLVEGHNWHKKSSECYSFVTSLCKKTGIEIFDSMEMLDFLISTERLSKPVENMIFVFACINFLIPALSLYQLNVSNFGRSVTRKCVQLNILQGILRLLLIDVPFFAVRFYIWIVHHSLSVFMMKNFFYIVLEVRELYVEILLHYKGKKKAKLQMEEIALRCEQTQTDGKRNVPS